MQTTENFEKELLSEIEDTYYLRPSLLNSI